MQTISLKNKEIGEKKPVFMMAQAGTNHNGDINAAKKLIDVAHDAGADAICFHIGLNERMVSSSIKNQQHIKPVNLRSLLYEIEISKQLEENSIAILKEYCKKKGIIFLVSPSDESELDIIKKYNLPLYKISSFNLTNLPFLELVAKEKKPIILSTGMSSFEEVKEAVEVIKKYNDKVILLQCDSNHPSIPKHANLKVIKTYNDKLKVLAGYSSHEEGIVTPIVAISLGAVVVEAHLTSDKIAGGLHKSLLKISNIKQFVRNIKGIEKIIGSGEKKINENEYKLKDIWQKSIVTRVKIPKGEIIKKDMLTVKSPGVGLKPKLIDKITGKKTREDIPADIIISLIMFE